MSQGSHFSRTFSRYLALRFVSGFLLVLVSVTGLIFLLETVELLRRAASRPDVTLQIVLQMSALKLPHTLQNAIPFALLFGAMFVFWRLNRSSELVIARASGFSVWQFLSPAIAVALVTGALYVAAVNPLGAATLLRFEQLEDDYFKGRRSQFSISRSGMWLRQADKGIQSVLHAEGMDAEDMVLRNVTVYVYDDEDRFIERLDAVEARLEIDRWRLTDVLVTKPGKPSVRQAKHEVPTNWTVDKIKDSFAPPETMSFWQLPGFISLLDKAGFTATRHRVYWYSLLALPVMLGAMVLIAASFSMRFARRGGATLLIGSGVLFSFFIVFVSDIVLAMGLSDTIPALLAAWTPAAVTLLIGITALLYMEEG